MVKPINLNKLIESEMNRKFNQYLRWELYDELSIGTRNILMDKIQDNIYRRFIYYLTMELDQLNEK